MKRTGQIWIETVLYTIIGLSIIAIVLAFIMPKINESKDNISVQQSISAMKELDSKINDVSQQQGNIGKVEFTIGRGYLDINSTNNSIIFVINDLSALYSEANVPIRNGNVQILSEKGQKYDSVYLTLAYRYNLTYNGNDAEKVLTAAPMPYEIYIENKNNNQLDITVG